MPRLFQITGKHAHHEERRGRKLFEILALTYARGPYAPGPLLIWKNMEVKYVPGHGITGGEAGGGGRVPPETSDWEIFADVSGKKEKG